MDVESAEEIVCATIDFDLVHSKFVSYEGESSPSSRPECKKRLETHNYSFVKMYGDALFRGPEVGLSAHAKENSPLESRGSLLGIYNQNVQVLTPNQPGLCVFHGQKTNGVGVAIFKALGGTVKEDGCIDSPVPGLTSDARRCPCTAPPADAFYLSFLEIGANDGVSYSELLFYETQMGWRGICVEANPSLYPLLVQNRPNCDCVNSLIAPEGTSAKFWTFSGGKNWEHYLSCMDGVPDCARKRNTMLNNPNVKVEEEMVPVTRLSTLFSDRSIKSLGWILMDVESAEEIVCATIDFDHVHSKLVSYEGESSPSSRPECKKRLETHGYSFVKMYGDALFRGPEVGLSAHAKENSPLESRGSLLGSYNQNVQVLTPNQPGLCVFHGQKTNGVGVAIFKALGGTVKEDGCIDSPVPGLTSDARRCPCTAPPADAFYLYRYSSSVPYPIRHITNSFRIA